MDRDEEAEFYEEDEPAEKIRAAFESGEKGVTKKRPRDLNQLAKSIVDDATAGPELVEVTTATVTFDSLTFTSVGIQADTPSRVRVG